MEPSWKGVPLKKMKKKQLLAVIDEMYAVIQKSIVINRAAAERIRQQSKEQPLIQTVN